MNNVSIVIIAEPQRHEDTKVKLDKWSIGTSAVLIMTFKAFIFSRRREKQGLKQHISPFFHSIQHKLILRSLIMRIAGNHHCDV